MNSETYEVSEYTLFEIFITEPPQNTMDFYKVTMDPPSIQDYSEYQLSIKFLTNTTLCTGQYLQVIFPKQYINSQFNNPY